MRHSWGTLRLRSVAVLVLDAMVVAISLYVALQLRIPGPWPEGLRSAAAASASVAAILAILLFRAGGIYRHSWRYFSLKDLVLLGQACTVLIGASLIINWLFLSHMHWLPRSVPIIQWFVLLVMLGALRAGRRIARELMHPAATADSGAPHSLRRKLAPGSTPDDVLLIGDPDWADSVLRTLKRGRNAGFTPVGILTHDNGDVQLGIHGVPVLGTIDNLEEVVGNLGRAKRRPAFVIVNQADPLLTGPRTVKLATRAAQLGLELARAHGAGELQQSSDGNLDLQFLNLTDLLGRPELRLDPSALNETICGQRVLVTGAGGTIGSELVRQIAASGAREILLLDHAEFNLYAIDLELRESFPAVRSTPLLCSVRQREAVMQIFAEHRPDLVFHAAALKHVPLVEANLSAGVLTNVIGTRNVADAVRAHGSRAMIQVSTDKAVNPVGMMGATKRLGELYCQALDLAVPANPAHSRFLTVRFGNVLGSSGSLIPLFLRQLRRRGPLTVTHPEIERYFMTVHEAVQLILHSAAGTLQGDIDRGRIFVLDMGEPIKIVEIARRIVRAAGLVPDVDVKIEFVGLRPGEKLFEELFDTSEERLPSSLPGIFEAEPQAMPLPVLTTLFSQLEELCRVGDCEAIRTIVRSVVDMHDDQVSAPAADDAAHVAPRRIPAVLQGAGQ